MRNQRRIHGVAWHGDVITKILCWVDFEFCTYSYDTYICMIPYVQVCTYDYNKHVTCIYIHVTCIYIWYWYVCMYDMYLPVCLSPYPYIVAILNFPSTKGTCTYVQSVIYPYDDDDDKKIFNRNGQRVNETLVTG